ncbi:serine hydrolase domain-containing protein [Spirillospora sp. NPDC048911]|uniref:serine hydrolase domain-containing protein n=1 Tax=Spirillospora sp. NPDC048911 TaxID=3364527 RepID=UPI00371137A2
MNARPVQGTVAEGFETVRDAFAEVVTAEPSLSAQLAVHVHGRQVVDLWTGDGVAGDSLLALYSSGKGAAHLVVALLAQDGVVDLDRPVAHYWPEFAAEGKSELTLRQLVGHSAGVIGVPGGMSPEELADDRLLARRLADQRPYWRPGSAYGYHAFTIGALTGEVVRRTTGASLQDVYERRVRVPYGLDFYLGLPEDEEARYLPAQPPPPELQAVADQHAPAPDSLPGITFNLNANPPTDLVAYANTRTVRALGPADAFGHSGAVGAQSFADPGSGVAYSYTRRRFSFGGGGGAPENRRLVAAVMHAAGQH